MHRFEPAPNLLLVGGPKTGTTSLMHWLRSHKQIYHPWPNESQFLIAGVAEFPTSPIHPKGIGILAPYADLSNYNKENYVMDKSAFHLYSTRALSSIKDQMPEAKVIITLRDPIDIMLSMHQEHRKRLIDYTLTQDEMIDFCREAGFVIDENNPQTYSFMRFPQLKQPVLEWVEKLGDRVRIIPINTIKAAPLQTLNEILEWLGIEKFSDDINLSKQNESGILNSARWARFVRTPPTLLVSLVKILIPTQKLRKAILDPIRSPAFKPKPYRRPELSEEVRKELETVFSEELEFQKNLSKYIDSNLIIDES
ncbi:MAG TPA: hypothetical protein EYP99_03345 [Candidatus Poseidoniales archaeon]|nr:hypothetical protein [Candidatus Poseidoniales archaeon]